MEIREFELKYELDRNKRDLKDEKYFISLGSKLGEILRFKVVKIIDAKFFLTFS